MILSMNVTADTEQMTEQKLSGVSVIREGS